MPIMPADFSIDEALAHKLIAAQFGIEIKSCRLLGEGFDNAVFLLNGHLVFRFPRTRQAIGLLENEIRLLSALSPILTVPIPKPLFIGMAEEGYAAPFYGHEFLIGRTGCSVKLTVKEQHALAHDIGVFLHRLHRVDITSLGLGPDELKPLWDRVDKPQMLTWLFERFNSVKELYDLYRYESKIDEIVKDAEAYIPKLKSPVLVHGDLYHRHLLFNEKQKLSGVIDWGDCCLSDRVVDFSVVFQFLPKATHASFFDVYGSVSDEERAYARFLGLYYALALLWFGNDRHDKALITTSLFALDVV